MFFPGRFAHSGCVSVCSTDRPLFKSCRTGVIYPYTVFFNKHYGLPFDQFA